MSVFFFGVRLVRLCPCVSADGLRDRLSASMSSCLNCLNAFVNRPELLFFRTLKASREEGEQVIN